MQDSLILPYIAPMMELGRTSYTPEFACREQFQLAFNAMLHYTRSVQHEHQIREWRGECYVHMFSHIPTNDHGFGDFVVLHLDQDYIVASMQHTSYYLPQGLKTVTYVPETIDDPDYGSWSHVAKTFADHTQLKRWSRVIRELDLVRYQGGADYQLFNMLARVPRR